MADAQVNLVIVAKNLTEAELNAVRTGLSDLNIKTQNLQLPLTQTGGLMGKLGEHFSAGEGSLRRLTSAVAFGAVGMSGMNAEAARLTEGLLLFGGGHGAVLVAAVAVAAIAGVIKLASTDFSEHGKHVAELEKRYGAMAKQLEQTGNELQDWRELQQATQEAVGKASSQIEAQRELALSNGEVWIQTAGDLNDVTEAQEKSTKQFEAQNAALHKLEEPALALQKSLDAQVIGFQKGHDAAELFKTGIANIDPELARNIAAEQEYISAHKIAAEAVIHHLDLLVKQGTTLGFTTEQVDAFRLQLVRAQAAQQGLNAAETEAKVREEEETLALTKLAEQQKKVNDERQKALDLFDKQRAQRAAGVGPDQSSQGADVAAELRDPIFKVLDEIDTRMSKFDKTTKDPLQDFAKAVGDDTAAWQKLRDEIANGVPVADAVSSILDTLGTMKDVTEILTKGFDALFTGIASGSGLSASAFLKAMAQMAASKASFEFAEGLAALASSIFPGIPSAGASAGHHFAAAAIFGTLAAGLSVAAGGGGGGAAGGGGSSLGTAGLSSLSNQLTNAQGPGTIVVEGGILDMSDPRQADALAQAIAALTGRRIQIAAYGTPLFGVT